MSKKVDEKTYRKICYVAKGLPFEKLDIPVKLEGLIDRSDFKGRNREIKEKEKK